MGEAVVNHGTWEDNLEYALWQMLVHMCPTDPESEVGIGQEHIHGTPKRVVAAFKEYFSGVHQDPEEVLRQGFEPGPYDAMIFVKNIGFTSFCAHHLIPFIGKVHFAYLPAQRIVGLSKIPRLIEVYSHRPQVQENLSTQIVDTFMKVVTPHGCGVVIEAVHMCMSVRGVRKEDAVTRTTALRGAFIRPEVKSEFLDGIR
jgi:GTP cyclohydrolase IA